ncbi:MAG: hypothetical protein Q8K73_00350 [Anaerolineales bacterium]|nr:hypothetical protein [Anaerolineales bacterium]
MTARNVPSFKSFAPQSVMEQSFRSLDYSKRGVNLLRDAAIPDSQAT